MVCLQKYINKEHFGKLKIRKKLQRNMFINKKKNNIFVMRKEHRVAHKGTIMLKGTKHIQQ